MKRSLLVFLVALLLLPALATAQTSELETRIVFVSERDGNEEIYVMNADGSNQMNLTNNPARDWHPVWSPDGTRIAFVSNRDGNEEIYIINADGTGLANLTNSPTPDNGPTWAPDGTRIAWASERGSWEIFAMNPDGSNIRQITSDGMIKTDPAWSPDGNLIAYWARVGGQTEIYTVNVNSGQASRLTQNGADDGWPKWSSDGLIMYDTRRDGNWEIYVMNADGSNQINLTRNGATDGRPSWSDWEWRIVFGSDRDGNLEIYSMIVDGTGLRRLTNNSAADHSPDWQPNPNFDGSVLGMTAFIQFAYTSDRLLIENPSADRWMFLTDLAVVDSAGARIPLDNLSSYGVDPAVLGERLGPGECIFFTTADAGNTIPPRPCDVVQQANVTQPFWVAGFTVDAVTSTETHTCTPAQASQLTLCLMPR
jgi:dipeptidyl aminopeptidase/acylaminoacyl peptidase